MSCVFSCACNLEVLLPYRKHVCGVFFFSGLVYACLLQSEIQAASLSSGALTDTGEVHTWGYGRSSLFVLFLLLQSNRV